MQINHQFAWVRSYINVTVMSRWYTWYNQVKYGLRHSRLCVYRALLASPLQISRAVQRRRAWFEKILKAHTHTYMRGMYPYKWTFKPAVMGNWWSARVCTGHDWRMEACEDWCMHLHDARLWTWLSDEPYTRPVKAMLLNSGIRINSVSNHLLKSQGYASNFCTYSIKIYNFFIIQLNDNFIEVNFVKFYILQQNNIKRYQYGYHSFQKIQYTYFQILFTKIMRFLYKV